MTLTEDQAPVRLQVSIGPQGRVVIPAPIRKDFGWKEGTVLTFLVQDGQVVVSDQREALRRFQEYAQSLIPEGMDVLQDFLDDRRNAAALENGENN